MSDLAICAKNGIATQSNSHVDIESSSTISAIAHFLVSSLWPLRYLVHLTVIGIPKLVLRLLSFSFSITLSFTTILIILGVFSVVSSVIIRYKILTSYSKSKEQETKTPTVTSSSLLSGANEQSKRRFPGSYIDEFLIAIKIFGYLEKPVFNELTKQMRTQKITSNEFLTMDENLGFAIVVEGNVQIYSIVGPSNRNGSDKDGENESGFGFQSLNMDDDIIQPETLSLNGEKYQLLNEVKSGNPLSSLINILSLFTEDDSISRSSPLLNTPELSKAFAQAHSNGANGTRNTFNNDIAPLDLNHPNLPEFTDLPETEINDAPNGNDPQTQPATPRQPPPPSIIARATKDSTIAIIPADAFQRLRKKYPRSSSHIVQMVLTKLYRVTFQTAHNYLGLTKEIFSSEINLNNEIQALNAKYNDISSDWTNSDLALDKDSLDSIRLKNLSSLTASHLLHHISPKLQNIKQRSKTSLNTSTSRPRARKSPSKHIILEKSHLHDSSSNPGDLLSNVPLSSKSTSNHLKSTGIVKNGSYGSSNDSFIMSDEDDNEDDSSSWFLEESQESELKTLIIEGMFRFLGVTKESLSPRKSSHGTGSSVVSSLNSPAGFGGFQTFSIIDSTSVNNQRSATTTSFGNKQRTFSSTSLNSSFAHINDSVDEHLNYDNAKNEFSQQIQVLAVEPGQVLVEQNTSSSKNNGLYFVLNGELEIIYEDNTKTEKAKQNNNGPSGSSGKLPTAKEHLVYTVKSGGVAGYLGSLIGSKSMVTIRCSSEKPSLVGFLSKYDLEKLCEKFFMIYLTIAKTLIRSLDSKLLKLDSALEWIQLDAGETLFKQDTNANGIYVVLNGRLRSIKQDQHSKELQILKEYGQSESFGEVEVLTAVKRSSSFVAVRDSELARIPRNLFEIMALENPGMMIKMSRIVAETIRKEQVDRVVENYYKIPSTGISNYPDLNKNYRTITVLPTTNGLPVMEFSRKLIQAFQDVNKSVVGLDQTMTLNHLGRYAFDKMFNLIQSGFFSDLEEKFDIVVYIADTAVNSTWTTTCIQQGDCILLLGDAEFGDPSNIGEYERLLLKCKTTARVELIMLHQEKYVQPGLVHKWLKNRIWVDSHHHIQFSAHRTPTNIPSTSKVPGVFQNNNLNILANTLKERVDLIRAKYGLPLSRHNTSPLIPHYKNDFMRLARILSGQAVGIILGGGGARGFSHLGVLKALEENGIPIDLIGGTSIGSFIGGLYAQDYDLVPIYGRAKKFAGRIGSIWRTLFDLTLPLVSYTTGHEFNRGLWKIFGDARIEDFWISFFCNTTNITNSCMEIHSSGHAWRFIRASMTLAGLLPPLAHNGSMLLDGGYVDNLPVDEMKRRGASIIFAVDVGSVDDRTPMNYGDSLSGAWCFWNKLNPFSKHPTVPTMSEIQMRLCYVSSVNALERAKASDGVIYLRPPVENYATLDFAKFEEIYNVGSVYGHMALNDLVEQNKLPDIAGMNVDGKKAKTAVRRNSI